MVGPANPLSAHLGFPFWNVTAKLFEKFHSIDEVVGMESQSQSEETDHDDKDDGQRVIVSLTQQEVPPFLATALGICNSSASIAESFPTDRINFQHAWKMSELIPFLGHIGLEKMTCDRSSAAQGEDEDGGGLNE
jgi:hypothetical protein